MKLPFMTSSLSTSSLWGPPDRRRGRRGAKLTLFGDQPIPAAILRFGRSRPLVEAVAKLPLPKRAKHVRAACLVKLRRRPFDLHLRAVGGQFSHRFERQQPAWKNMRPRPTGTSITWEWSSRTGCPHALHVARNSPFLTRHSCVPARRLGGSAECAHRQAVRTLRRRGQLTQPTLVLGLCASCDCASRAV